MGADRRHFLMGAAATGAALAAGPALAARTKAGPKAGPKGDPALHRLLDAFADEILDEAPEAATSLGLDNGRRAALKSRLSDRSWAAVEKGAQACADRLGRLKALERSRLGGQDLVYYDSMLYALQMGLEGARFAFGDNAFDTVVAEGTTPYVVSQQTGVFTSLPEFLNSQHKIATRADCDAYLARVEAFAKALDQETDRVRRDAGAGVVAPDFILKTTLDQMTEYRGQKAAETGLVKSLAERAKAKGIAGDWAGQAAALVSDKVFPALDRQIAEVKAAQAKARHDAGVWKLPDGEAYYAWLLKVGTTTALNADDIHKMGLEQNRAIESRMDALLKAQGLTQGTVGERMQALADPEYAQGQEAQQVGDEAGGEPDQRAPELGLAMDRRVGRHPDLQDDQGHGDGEQAVAEGGDPLQAAACEQVVGFAHGHAPCAVSTQDRPNPHLNPVRRPAASLGRGTGGRQRPIAGAGLTRKWPDCRNARGSRQVVSSGAAMRSDAF
ncbi:DUF885 family protein [Caulobacter sp. CCUG 60055]|uniref:DUF885 domain-containing protein n=1 Tax=Caulobacter sp. CCUG 60055 TaxID=2100090 RepID=UPI001FA7E392|nr:DUF885 family protein [Caulobacter sp. CCUG 60055]